MQTAHDHNDNDLFFPTSTHNHGGEAFPAAHLHDLQAAAAAQRRPLTALDRAFALLGLLDNGHLDLTVPPSHGQQQHYSGQGDEQVRRGSLLASLLHLVGTRAFWWRSGAITSEEGQGAGSPQSPAFRLVEQPRHPFLPLSTTRFIHPFLTAATRGSGRGQDRRGSQSGRNFIQLPAYDLSPDMFSSVEEHPTIDRRKNKAGLSTELQLQILTHLASPFCGRDPSTVLLLSKSHYQYFLPRVYHTVTLSSGWQLNKLRTTLALHNPRLGKLIRSLQIAQVDSEAYDALGYLPSKFILSDALALSTSLEQILLASGDTLERIHLDMFTLSALTSAGTASRLEKGALPTWLSTELSSPAALCLPTFSAVEHLELLTFGLDPATAVQVRTALPTTRTVQLRWVSRRAAAEAARFQMFESKTSSDSGQDARLSDDMTSSMMAGEHHSSDLDFAGKGKASFGMGMLEQRQWEQDLRHFIEAIESLRTWPPSASGGPSDEPQQQQPVEGQQEDGPERQLDHTAMAEALAAAVGNPNHVPLEPNGPRLEKLIIKTWPGAMIRLREAIPDALPLSQLRAHAGPTSTASPAISSTCGAAQPSRFAHPPTASPQKTPLYIGLDEVWTRGTRRGAAQLWYMQRMGEVWA